jgi:hypothetical protein
MLVRWYSPIARPQPSATTTTANTRHPIGTFHGFRCRFSCRSLSLLLLLNFDLFARKNWRLRRRLVADGGAD